MGDQLVIYQFIAAAAQVAIIVVVTGASIAGLRAADKLGITDKAKGIITKGKGWGQTVKGNAAYQRGKATRKSTKQAIKDENFARNRIRRNIAGGIPMTKKQKKAREAVLLNADHTVRKHEAEEAGIMAEDLRRRGRTSDDTLRDIALGREPEGRSDAGRRAAMSLLAENGRVSRLRQVQQELDRQDPSGLGDDQRRFREVITANSGRLYGKAPDLNPGNRAPGAFGDASASDLAGWHHSTINTALEAARNDPTGKLRTELEKAYKEAWANPNLRGNFTPEALQHLQNEFGAIPVTPPAPTPPPAGGGPGVLNVPHPGPAVPPPAAGGGTSPPSPGGGPLPPTPAPGTPPPRPAPPTPPPTGGTQTPPPPPPQTGVDDSEPPRYM